ncbi:hypothetical protein M7I_3397 [Glarea lozoyensis 74030]|uniref:Uncharacterized protein n=1 Tax=Glarea lozoyensis (strain ATCC 74030 / MF5533) TaxID=1104152 RepID=H0ELD4_GLAL7|nr:hypothetical protein M7I_3397 [Glarea lozoyensis 74030]
MAPYDSDSDDGDDAASYTETNVLLGYAAEEPSDDTISYLGGTPSWINDETLPSATLAKCKAERRKCQSIAKFKNICRAEESGAKEGGSGGETKGQYWRNIIWVKRKQ